MVTAPHEIFKVLSSPIKYGIIEILGSNRRLAFKDIEDELKRLTRSEVYSSLLSNHLRVLKNSGYVDQDSRGLYYLTDKGIIAYNLINAAKQNIISKIDKKIVDEEFYSEDMQKKVSDLYVQLSIPGSYKRRRRLLSKILSQLAQDEEEAIPISRALLHVIYNLEREGSLSKTPYTLRLHDKHLHAIDNVALRDSAVTEYTYMFVQDNSLLKLFSENSVYMKLHPSGVLTLNLVDPPKQKLINVLRKNHLYWELNLIFNNTFIKNISEILPLLDSQLKLTISINIEEIDPSYIENSLKKMSLNKFPLKNVLIVIKYKNTLLQNKNLIKILSKLINKGYSILFSKSHILPTINHVPSNTSSTSAVLGSVSLLLPSIFLSEKPVNPLEKITYTIRDIRNIILNKKLRKIQYTLNSLEIRKYELYMHYSFAGLEAALIAINPPYRDLISDASSISYSSKILLSKAEKIIKNIMTIDGGAGISGVTTFYSPLYPFHKALSKYLVDEKPLYLHVNSYSMASYNTALGMESFLKKNSATHTLPLGHPPYIVEAKMGTRVSAFLLEKAIRVMEQHQIMLYSFSLFPLQRCGSCGYTSPTLRTVCPICFSKDIVTLFRPTLMYTSLKAPYTDRYMLEEYSSRPSLSKFLSSTRLNH